MSEDRSLREIRLEKLERLRALGMDPFQQEKFESSHSATQLLDQFDQLQDQEIRLAGRLVSYRLMGKAGFAHLSDGEGKIQAYFKRDLLTENLWEAYSELLDIGDHLGVQGKLFVTKTGEKTIEVHSFVPLSKSLQPLPLGKEKDGERWYGLADAETRFRHRHLDLIANPEARRRLVDRMKITASVRRYFDQAGYLEAETPMLQVVAGGAAARPFKTHYNVYDLDVKLRISLELYLKRLICGDIPRVYEIGRVFRNEGVSTRHNPEFTLLEFYEAYANLEDMMRRVEELFRFVALEVYGTCVVQVPEHEGMRPAERAQLVEGHLPIDFSRPWARVNMLDAIETATGLTREDLSDLSRATQRIQELGLTDPESGKHIELAKERNLGGLIEKLLEVYVEPQLVQPSFVVGYPIETSPLAKKDPSHPGMTRRFEGYIGCREVCNAFSEINDPIDQHERFLHQVEQLGKGDDEAHPYDEEFLYALEGGMPPTGGCGIGIDRMAMVLTGADSLREVLLFPMMKPTSD